MLLIHLNPVQHEIVKLPEAWPYSNCLDWIGRRAGTLIDRELVRAYFATPADYEALVQDALPAWDPAAFQEAATFLES